MPKKFKPSVPGIKPIFCDTDDDAIPPIKPQDKPPVFDIKRLDKFTDEDVVIPPRVPSPTAIEVDAGVDPEEESRLLSAI